MRATLPAYAELACRSHFSFLQAASAPEALVQQAHQLGYTALALTDEASVAGVVRAHAEAKRCGLKLLPGARFTLPNGWTLVALPRQLEGWTQLCTVITQARMAATKGSYLVQNDAPAWGQALLGCELLVAPAPYAIHDVHAANQALAWLTALTQAHPSVSLMAVRGLRLDDESWLDQLQALATATATPVAASGDVRMHRRGAKPLLDVLTAVARRTPLHACGDALAVNAAAAMRTRMQLHRLFPADWLAHTVTVARRCTFDLSQLRYRYPTEVITPGQTPSQSLAQLTWQGAAQRYPAGIPPSVQQAVAHELALIAELQYEMYFLTVYDLVRFARSRDILCQGRGSAANSAVCYCLGITEVDPARSTLLFERFISRARDEPPDIDVDFEHQRREEVIQYIYQKYGRARAALAATVISYRPRSALRDVGMALAVDDELVQAMAREHPGMHAQEVRQAALEEALKRLGRDPALAQSHRLRWWLTLAQQLLGTPRHLGQHPGGFVLTQGPLHALVPIENARMPDRSLIQWDKDDLDTVGLLKVDVLGLGMLSVLRRGLALMAQCHGRALTLQDIPAEDPATYDMLCQADSMGVFQVESRAQMAMLPRLRPRCFYDLVVEVAIVRPGPIQGGMVHPYLRRRQGLEPVDVPGPGLQQALGRTLGVPVFQEQVMQVAMLAAGFDADEADSLRRAMAAWRRRGGVHRFYQRIVSGMVARGYDATFAEQIFEQIQGFGEYGFPESHAASFALLVYVSAWMKCHEPACFLAALLNSQPMGFYRPAQLVQDAKRHGVQVLPVDVLHSDWDCTLEGPKRDRVRLGLRLVSGLGQAQAQRVVQACRAQPPIDVADLAARASLPSATLRLLAHANALSGLAGPRPQQWWEAAAVQPATPLPMTVRSDPADEVAWPAPSAPQQVWHDYRSTGLSLHGHPLQFLRAKLHARGVQRARDLHPVAHGRRVRAAGLVTMRQQPSSANGVLFVTLEDETGHVNVIVWPKLKQRHAAVWRHARLLVVHGVWQRDQVAGQVTHVVAAWAQDISDWLGTLPSPSRDFH